MFTTCRHAGFDRHDLERIADRQDLREVVVDRPAQARGEHEQAAVSVDAPARHLQPEDRRCPEDDGTAESRAPAEELAQHDDADQERQGTFEVQEE